MAQQTATRTDCSHRPLDVSNRVIGLALEPMEQSGPGKRERNKADKQRRILEAADALFRTHGFESTTTAQIAAAAGVGEGTIYLYVGSKEDLLVSVFRRSAGAAWDQSWNELDRSAPVLDQLVGLFGRVTRVHDGEIELARAYFRQLEYVDEPARTGVDEFMRSIYDRLCELLDAAQSRGLLDPEVPVRTLSGNLFARWYLRMQRHTARGHALEHTLRWLAEDFRVALWGMIPPD